jgi:hypothetical protein
MHDQHAARLMQAIQNRLDALALGLAPDQLESGVAPSVPGHDASISPRDRTVTTARGIADRPIGDSSVDLCRADREGSWVRA